MCAICQHTPCLRRCPNADIPVFDICRRCGNDIERGDSYAEINGENICENCLNSMKTRQILALFDVYIQEAS